MMEAFQQANEADIQTAGVPLDEERANRILSELGFVAEPHDPASGIPDDGSVYWRRDTESYHDVAFVDPIGNPNPDPPGSGGDPIPPGVFVRLNNPQSNAQGDHRFVFGRDTVDEFESVLTHGQPAS